MKTKSVRGAAFLLGILAAGFALSSCSEDSSGIEAVRSIPIQHNGRVKSFEAFSRQTLEGITQKESWKGQGAAAVVWQALADHSTIQDIPWIKIGSKELVSYLDLPERQPSYFSFNEVHPSMDKLEGLVRSSRKKRDTDERPSFLEQKAESLDAAMYETMGLATGETVKVIAPPEGDTWMSPYTVEGPPSEQFKELTRLFKEKKTAELGTKIRDWKRKIHEITGGKYSAIMTLEVLYFGVRPLQWAWILYLSAFLFLSVLPKKKTIRISGAALLASAVFFHTFGLVLRVLILQRPPVSNMYESMIYMNWVLIVLAVIFSVVKKNLTVASVGSLISAIILIYGNLLPVDSSLDVLVPVLRSNYWLTIHVMTIVSSYGVFGLAMGLGHRYLILWMRGKLTKSEEERSAKTLDRVIQIGILLLGIGTVLGGVWANESWGRFWGWDPKETWALITFLGYLIVVHLKLTKVLSSFALAVSSILGFQLVLMTWYGVNFVLGRGLHSYGRGAGGMEWVILYLILESIFVGWVLAHRLQKKQTIGR